MSKWPVTFLITCFPIGLVTGCASYTGTPVASWSGVYVTSGVAEDCELNDEKQYAFKLKHRMIAPNMAEGTTVRLTDENNGAIYEGVVYRYQRQLSLDYAQKIVFEPIKPLPKDRSILGLAKRIEYSNELEGTTLNRIYVSFVRCDNVNFAEVGKFTPN